MPYKSFRELAGESGNVNSAFQTSYTKTFLIEVDSATDSVFYVGSHPQLPLLYSQHPADNRAFCVSINPQQDQANPLIWRVTCQWSMTLDGAGVGGMPVATGNPFVDSQQHGKPASSRVAEPTRRGNDYSYSTTTLRKAVVDTDFVTGKPIVNSAGDYFATLPEIEIFALEITVGRNLPGAPSAEWDELNGTLNRNQITVGTRVCPPRTVMMMATNANLVTENNETYWRWTHRLVIRPASEWKWRVLSKGKNALLPFRDGPGAGAAIVYRIGNIQKMYRHLSGDQNLDENGRVVSMTPNAKDHIMEFDYIPDATFPAVL